MRGHVDGSARLQTVRGSNNPFDHASTTQLTNYGSPFQRAEDALLVSSEEVPLQSPRLEALLNSLQVLAN